jgi:hypothetical protein
MNQQIIDSKQGKKMNQKCLRTWCIGENSVEKNSIKRRLIKVNNFKFPYFFHRLNIFRINKTGWLIRTVHTTRIGAA